MSQRNKKRSYQTSESGNEQGNLRRMMKGGTRVEILAQDDADETWYSGIITDTEQQHQQQKQQQEEEEEEEEEKLPKIKNSSTTVGNPDQKQMMVRVKYDTTEVTEDVCVSRVRPVPLPTPTPDIMNSSSFRNGDTVDVRMKGLWRRGVVLGHLRRTHYSVSVRRSVHQVAVLFPGSLLLMAFLPSQLRHAKVWKHRRWFAVLRQEGIPSLEDVLEDPMLVDKVRLGTKLKRAPACSMKNKKKV